MARTRARHRVGGWEQDLFSRRFAGNLPGRKGMKIQTGIKIQTPRSKLQRGSKHQDPRARTAVGVWNLVFIWSLVLGSWSFSRAAETNDAPHAFVPSTKYASTRLAGWTVRVNRQLLTT